MRGLVLLPWNPTPFNTLSPSPSLPFFDLHHKPHKPFTLSIHASSSSSPPSSLEPTEELTARERRRLRNERRERNAYNWREEVEERFIKKTKKETKSWKDELNLDNLGKLGPQWYVVRVSRVKDQYIKDLLARALARNFPGLDFKVYLPAVHEKRKLKDGSCSVKPKPLFPGCVFLRCVLNKELHDFIREIDGVGGFVGSKVGNTKRQINKPRPVDDEDMEAIFRQAKEEQQKANQAFEEQEKIAVQKSEIPNAELEPDDVTHTVVDSKPKRRSRKTSNQLAVTDAPSGKKISKLLAPGYTVRVVSGTFSGFAGTLKKLNRKTKLATVHFTLFGKENIVDLDVSEIAPETN